MPISPDFVNRGAASKVFWQVIILSGFLGFLMGWLRAEYQWSVEPAAVMAGIVEYPVKENAFNVCAYKNWTLVNQLCALYLYLGGSEITLSYILSGLAGLLVFQSISLVVFAISLSPLFAALSPFFLFQVYGVVTHGITYPILLLGSGQTYGMLGLSLGLIVIGLFINGYRKTAIFLTGLAPAIHPSQGLWLACYFGLSVLFTYGMKRTVVNFWKPALAGAGFAAISLAIHFRYFYYVPVIAPEILAEYQSALKDFWSEHYMPFLWKSGRTLTVAASFGFCFIAFYFRLFFGPRIRVLFLSCIFSVILAAMFSFVYWIPGAEIQKYYVILMMYPGRTFNFSIFLAGLLVVGLVGRKTSRLGSFVWLLVLPVFLLSKEDMITYNRPALGLVAVLGFLLLMLLLRNSRNSIAKSYEPGKWLPLLLVPLAVFHLVKSFDIFLENRKNYFLDYSNDNFYRRISDDKVGMIVPGAREVGYLQARTRRPIVYLGGPLILNYAPEAAENFGAMFREIYGVDFLHPPEDLNQYGRGLPAEQVRALWAKRSVEEWKSLAKKFKISHVFERVDFPLQLPLVATNGEFNYYEIPL